MLPKILVLVRKIKGHKFSMENIPEENYDFYTLDIKEEKDLSYVIESLQEEYFSGIIFEGFYDEKGLDLFYMYITIIRNMSLGKNTPCDVPIALMTYEKVESLTDLPIAVLCMPDYKSHVCDYLYHNNVLIEKTYRSGFLPFTEFTLQDRPKSIAFHVQEIFHDHEKERDPIVVWISKDNKSVLDFSGDLITDFALYLGRTIEKQ